MSGVDRARTSHAACTTASATLHRVIVPEPRPTSDVPYHHDRAPGQKYLVLADSVVPGSPLYVAARRVDWVPPDQTQWLDPHEHNCNSFYIFIGDGPDLTGLHGTAEIGDASFAIDAPAAVLIPSYVLHQYRITAGSGWYFQITLRREYTESLVPADLVGQHRDPSPKASEVYKTARRMGVTWNFVGPDVFRNAGLCVAATALPGLLPPAKLAAGAVCLNLLISRGCERLMARLTCHEPVVTVTAPCAALHVGTGLTLEVIEGSGLLVQIVPEAPIQWLVPAIGKGGDSVLS